MTPAQKDDGPASRGYGQGYEYFAMALTFVVAILLFGAAGWFLDGLLHTRPLLAIIGAFVGGFAGFMRIYYRVKADTAAKGGAANTAAKGGEGRRKGGEG
jgi:F0F1-type ATP synthase assembly protein I